MSAGQMSDTSQKNRAVLCSSGHGGLVQLCVTPVMGQSQAHTLAFDYTLVELLLTGRK